MKKIISFALILTMLTSIFAFNASAAGILVQANMESEAALLEKFYLGSYYLNDGMLVGYSEAMCLQTLDEWITCDSSVTVILNDDDLVDSERGYSLWYPNTNLFTHGLYEGTLQMIYGYSIDNREFTLSCADLDNPGEVVNLVEPVPYELEDDHEYTFGMSISRGRLRCFLDDNLILDFVDTNDTYLIGLDDGISTPTCHVFWNNGNFVQIKDVKIATSEYLYPPTPIEQSTTAPAVTTTAISQVVVTDKEGNAVTNEAGEKVTEAVIITDAPADTHTGAVQGGSSTSTGDKAVMVVAAMIVAIGSALIIRKVNVE